MRKVLKKPTKKNLASDWPDIKFPPINLWTVPQGQQMTLPIERTNAVLRTEKFLIDLCDPKKYPRVPYGVREEARRLLRHYPTKYDLVYIDSSFEPLDEKNL